MILPETLRPTRDPLQELAGLSEKHGYTWQAAYIRETVSAFEQSVESGWEHLVSIEFWGGAGSIADVSFNPDDIAWHEQNGRPVPEVLRQLGPLGYQADRRRWTELLCTLADTVQSQAPTTPSNLRWRLRAIQIGAVDRQFLTNGSI